MFKPKEVKKSIGAAGKGKLGLKEKKVKHNTKIVVKGLGKKSK